MTFSLGVFLFAESNRELGLKFILALLKEVGLYLVDFCPNIELNVFGLLPVCCPAQLWEDTMFCFKLYFPVSSDEADDIIICCISASGSNIFP
jgi:hypothetical protein